MCTTALWNSDHWGGQHAGSVDELGATGTMHVGDVVEALIFAQRVDKGCHLGEVMDDRLELATVSGQERIKVGLVEDGGL